MSAPEQPMRDRHAFLMLCAWNNIRPDQAPGNFVAFANPHTMESWARVADASKAYLGMEEPPSDVKRDGHVMALQRRIRELETDAGKLEWELKQAQRKLATALAAIPEPQP